VIGAGARITVALEGEGAPVELITRPVDLFTAEAAIGYDPLSEIATAATVGAVSTRILRGLIALAWAAYNRGNPGAALTLEVFTERLEAMPTVKTEEEDSRPTPAAVSTG